MEKLRGLPEKTERFMNRIGIPGGYILKARNQAAAALRGSKPEDGRDGFDRGNWTVRQAGCRLFRIGELEYELFERNGQRAVSIHIPSDARLEPDLLNGSVRQAEAFLSDFFPEWEKLPMICESWLLSPSLKEMLPPESRIRRFQDAFDITEEDPEDTSALEWVFFIAEGQRDSVRYENLPEDTSLQRKMKAALLAGRNPGNAGGTLARAFR